MITIISGRIGSGKTTQSAELIEGKKAILTTKYNLSQDLKSIEENTDVIVIDEFGQTVSLEMMVFLKSQNIQVRKPYERLARSYKRPDLILICQGEPFDFGRSGEEVVYINMDNFTK